MNILKVSDERWAQAQKDELHYWATQGPEGDDWNKWWQEQFEDYYFVPNKAPRSMLDVGCGPYAGNTIRILACRPAPSNFIVLNDPLMDEFLKQEKMVSKMDCMFNMSPLEQLKIDMTFDVIICINVLDHVQDVAACFERMMVHLTRHGMLILGQDLSNEIDYKNCPESWEDTKHPIKMDLESLAPFIFPHYQTKFLKIVPRDKGRNPKAHYATICFAGVKI